MIVRNLGIRHGRRVVASSFPRRCLRSFTSDPYDPTPNAIPTDPSAPMPTAYAEPPSAEAGASKSDLFIPKTQQTKPTNPAVLAKMAQDEAIARIPGDWEAAKAIHAATRELGGVADDTRWKASQLLQDAPADASLELLMASQAHMGHHPSLWNPNNSRYIYGVRAGIHIISLEQTQAHLRRAARVVEEVAYRGGLILFVGTRRGHMPIVVRAAELARGCHLFQKWKPGTITNRDQILAGGQLQVVNELDKPLSGFESHLQDRRPLVPDLVVCLNPTENYTMLYECGLENIPTIGVIDTNADPTWVTYSIPANDDSFRCLTVIASVLGRAGERGQRRRLESARRGKVTWQSPQEVLQWMKQDAMEKAQQAMKDKSAAGQELAQDGEDVPRTKLDDKLLEGFNEPGEKDSQEDIDPTKEEEAEDLVTRLVPDLSKFSQENEEPSKEVEADGEVGAKVFDEPQLEFTETYQEETVDEVHETPVPDYFEARRQSLKDVEADAEVAETSQEANVERIDEISIPINFEATEESGKQIKVEAVETVAAESEAVETEAIKSEAADAEVVETEAVEFKNVQAEASEAEVQIADISREEKVDAVDVINEVAEEAKQDEAPQQAEAPKESETAKEVEASPVETRPEETSKLGSEKELSPEDEIAALKKRLAEAESKNKALQGSRNKPE